MWEVQQHVNRQTLAKLYNDYIVKCIVNNKKSISNKLDYYMNKI